MGFEEVIGIYSNNPLFGMVLTASEGHRNINVSSFVVVPRIANVNNHAHNRALVTKFLFPDAAFPVYLSGVFDEHRN